MVCETNCLEQLGRNKEALLTILPEALDSYGSANYGMVVKKAMNLIETHFNKEEIRVQLDLALCSMSPVAEDITFSISFKGTELILDPYTRDSFTVRSVRDAMKAAEFWAQLNEK